MLIAVLLIVALSATLVWYGDVSGEVVFTLADGAYTMTLLQFVAAAALAAAGLYLLVALLSWCIDLPSRLRGAGRTRRRRQAEQALQKGCALLIQTHWADAERLLVRHARFSAHPALHYVLAATAAAQRHEVRRVDHYLRLAGSDDTFSMETLLTWQAQLSIWRGDAIEALTALEKLQHRTPKNVQVNQLLLDVYVQQHHWQAVQKQLTHMRKYKCVDETRYLRTMRQCALGLIDDAATDGERLLALAPLVDKLSQYSDVTERYVATLLQRGYVEQARKLLLRALDADTPDERFFALLATLPMEADTLYAQAKRLWEKHQTIAARLVLARMAARLGKLAEARRHLEVIVRDRPTAREAWWLFADVLYKDNEPDKALQCYREVMRINEQLVSDGDAHQTATELPVQRADALMAPGQTTARQRKAAAQ